MISFVNTDFSLCSTFKPEDMKNQCILCDNNLSGAVEYYKACNKKGFKPIIGYRGEEIYIARNKAEYKELLCAFSDERTPVALTIVGAPFGKLANLVTDSYFPYVPNEDAWEIGKEYLKSLTGDVVVGITPYQGDVYEALRDLLRDLADHLSLSTCLVDDAHYVSNLAVSDGVEYQPHKDHQILVCRRTKKNVDQYEEMEDKYKRFFLSDQYFPQDWSYLEHLGTQKLVDECEEYDILSDPQLPHIEDSPEKLAELCREGWKRLELSKRDDWRVYRDRVKEELETIKISGFSSYFLILADICSWVDEQGWMRGHGRGSAGGCLLSYLIGITMVDPIKYGLLMDRFYSSDRAEARQLPDIDIDVPKFQREEIFAYIQNKYGHESVAQMVTFSSLQGRSALTATLKFNDSCGFSESKEITMLLPHKDKVSDQMEVVDEHSLIRWTLEFLPDRMSNYARLDNGKIVGDYAKEFEQAIRLEKVKTETSKHACAVIVYSGKLKDICPMIKDKSSGELITGFSMSDGEAVGLLKLDLLGLAVLNKLMLIKELLKEKEDNEKKKQNLDR
jgi:DNA polymerase-3 subunit alpha